MTLLVVAGVAVVGMLSVFGYRWWQKTMSDDDDDLEIDGEMRTRIRHGGL